MRYTAEKKAKQQVQYGHARLFDPRVNASTDGQSIERIMETD